MGAGLSLLFGSGLALARTTCSLFTGSISSSFLPSKSDTSDVVGFIDSVSGVSVGPKPRLDEADRILAAPRLCLLVPGPLAPPREALAFGGGMGDVDLLAASVAASNDADGCCFPLSLLGRPIPGGERKVLELLFPGLSEYCASRWATSPFSSSLSCTLELPPVS